MVIRQDIGHQDSQELQDSGAEQNHAGNSYPAVYLPDASFLLDGNYEKAGFDLVITNPAGETFIVKDYFAFNPPPNLMLSSGAGLSPEMVARLMHLPFGADVMFAGPATSPGAMIEIGEVRFVRGDVRVRRADGSEITLKKGDILYQGDEILTGPMAFIRASMKDGTRFHLGRNGRATLDKYEFSEAETKGTFEASVLKGGFHYKSGKIGQLMAPLGQKHSIISTPTAVIGIRGSELDGHVADDGSTTVRHTSGILEITNINGNNPVELTQPGTGTVILLGGSPEGFTQLPPQYNEQLNQNLPPAETSEEVAEEDDGQEEIEDEAPAGEPGDSDGPGDDETGSDEQITDEAPVEDDSGEDDGDEDAGEEDPDAGEGEEETPAEGDGEPAEDLTGTDDRSGSSEREAGTGESGENDTPPAEDSAGSAGNETDNESDTGDETSTSSTSRQTEEVDVTAQETGTSTTTPGTTGTGNRPVTPQTGAAPGQVEPDSEESDDTEEPVAEELPPDNPPVAVDDVLQVDSAGSREISAFLLQNDRDADAGQIPRIVGISGEGSRGGTVSFVNGRVTYTPDADQLGSLGSGNTATETFTYRVQTGDLTDSATLTVRLLGSNRAPVARDDSAVAVEDTPITINVIGNDTDPDGDSLDVISFDGGRGTISNLASAGLQYTPPEDLRAGEVITDTFTYTISDGELSSTATVSVTVTGRNDPPVINTTAEPFEVQASAGPTEIPLSAIFSDSDLGDQLTVVSIDTTETRSTVTIGSIIVDPGDVWDFLAQGEIGTDVFGVTVRDEFNATGSGRYTFEIIGVNDAPVANSDQYSLVGGEPNSIDVGLGLLANDTDVDNGAELSVTAITAQPAFGSLSFAADGSFVYTPVDGFQGTDQFVYQVSDEYGAVSSARVTLNVGPTNEPPVANPDQFTISNSGVVTGNLLANDLDQEGEPITASLATPPANGSVSVAVDGSFTYIPEADFTGTDTFTYEVSDSGGRTSEGTVTVEVLGQNEPPVATAPGNQSIALDEPFSLDLNSVFSDPEGTPLVYSFSSTSGLVMLTGATLVIDPAGANAGDAFDVVLRASDGENTTTTSFSVDLVSGNSPPELVAPIGPISIAEGGSLVVGLASQFTDPDGDPLTIFASGQPSFVTLSGSSLLITPQSGDTGTYSIVVGADDGQATATSTFSLTVTPPIVPPNLAPVITAPASISLIEDAPFSPVISISDADAGTDPILVSLSGGGVLSISGPADLYGTTQLGSAPLGQVVAAGDEVFIRFDLVDASFRDAISPTSVFMYTAGAQVAADSIVDGGAPGDSSFTARFVSPASDPFQPWSFTYFNTQLQTFSTSGTFDVAFYNTATDALVESNEIASERGVPLLIYAYQLEGSIDDVNTTLGSLTVQPFADLNTATSTATFNIFVDDQGNNGGAPATSSASIQLDITPVPDPPQAYDIFYGSYIEDFAGVISINPTLYSFDADGDPLTITKIDGNTILPTQTVLVANGSVTLQADNQTIEFEADAEYSGSIAFDYTVSDGSSTAVATITLSITPVNDSPVITAPTSITSPEDQALSPVISVSDVDAGTGSISVRLDVPGEISISGPATLSSAPFAYIDFGQPFAAGDEVFVRFDYTNALIKDVSALDIRFVKDGSVVYSDAIVAGGGIADTFVVVSFTSTAAAPFDGSEFVNANAELDNFTGPVTYDAAVFETLADAVAQTNPVQTNTAVDVEFSNYILTGTVADVNASLSTLSIQPRPGYNSDAYPAFLNIYVDDLGNSGGFSSPAFVSIPLDITPVNDPPVANSDSYIGLQEDQLFTFNPTFNDTDPELDALTVTEINGTAILPTQSVLVTNGTVTLQGDGQSLEFLPEAEYSGSIAFNYTVSDGSSSATTSISLTIDPVNDTPVITAPASITTLEDQSFSPAISISDVDAGSGLIQVDINAPGEIFISGPVSLSGVVVTYGVLSQAVAAGSEVFVRFDYSNATIKSVIATTDLWIFNNGGQLFADSITAGGGVGDTFVTARFVSPAVEPFTAFSAVNIVAELENVSSIVTRDVAIYNSSADALAQANAASIELGVPLEFSNYQLTGTIADVNAALSTLTVQPYTDFNTSSSTANLSIVANDLGNSGGGAAIDSVFIPVNITPVNDPPFANDDFFSSIPEDATGTLTYNPTLNDYDPEFASLTITEIDGNPILPTGSVAVVNGTVTLQGDGQTLAFQADPNYFGPISFGYTVSDGTDTATATVSLSVFAVNDPPVADDESFTVLEGATATDSDLDAGLTLLDGDTDLDGDILTATVLIGPSHATAFTLNPDGTFSYTHDGSENHTDSFSYQASDGFFADTATVTVTITPVNDNAPVADDESFSVNEGGSATEANLDAGTSLLDGDTDADLPGDTLQTFLLSGPSFDAGGFTLNTDGTFSYTHDGSENYSDSFQYHVFDGANTDTGTVTITINPVNDNAPVADDESFTVLEGGTATVSDLDAGTSLLDGDTDLDGDTLTATVLAGPSNASAFTLNLDGTFSYTHDDSENHTDSFTYRVSDGTSSDTGTVTITVTPQNDNVPVADDESFTVSEGGSATEANLDAGTSLLDGDTDADLPGDTLQTFLLSGPSFDAGGFVLNTDGTFSYTHDGSENYSDSFQYHVFDGANTDTGTVTISITPVNDNAPVADNDTLTVGVGQTGTEADLTDGSVDLLDGDVDLDGDALMVDTTPVSGPAFASAFTLNTDGTFSYTHDGSANYTDSFIYRVSDGLNTDTATVSITITQTPFLISPDFDTVIINAGDSISLPIGFSDPDFDALTSSATGLPGWASISTSIPSPPGDAVISGTAVTGTSTVTVSATDGVGTATETFVLDAQASAGLQVGTAGNDLFLGSDGNDTIQGGAGDDEILYSGNQSDYTYTATYSAGVVTITVTDNVGTDGVDVITGVESIQFADGPLSGPLTINGSSLADTITGSLGADIINGNNGNDIIDGLGGNDTINGGTLDDNLVGGDGDDVIYGGTGADILTGGEGNDLLDGNDSGNLGDADIDIAIFSGNRSDYDISPDPLLAGATGTLTFTVTDLAGTDGTDTVSDIERLQFADMTIDLPYDLRGSSLADVLTGGLLADYIVAINGNDTIDGLAGDDYVDAGTGDDVIAGSDGADTIFGGTGHDTITGGPGNDFIDGNDSGTIGDPDIDVAVYSGNIGDYTIIVTGTGTTTTATVTGPDGADSLEDIDRLQFDDGTVDLPMDLRGTSLADILTSGSENDHVVTINGNDVINTLAGDDYVDAGSGDDVVDGGTGHDILFGGGGADSLTGGEGDDFLDGNDASSLGDAGIDVAIYSGNRVDYSIHVNGTGTTTTVTVTHNLGTDGTDILEDIDQLQFADMAVDLPRDLRGSSVADILVGGAEHDHIVAIGGDDTITGAGGGDYIDGGDGADSIDSGIGFDYIIGGNGADILTGGPGQDVFVLQDANDSTATSVDTITDFTVGEDVIKFEGMSGITLDPVPFAYNPGGVAATIVDIVADVGITNNAVFFQDSTDGYIYIKGAGVGTSFDGTLVKLSGILSIPADIDFDPVLGAGNALPQGGLQLLDTFGDFTIHDGTSFNVLTVDTTSLSDANGLGTFSYQWYSDASPVGIDSPNYTTTEFDVGTEVYVEVSYIDGGSNAESVFSPSVYVAPQNPDVAGIETYVMSFMDDFVFGSSGNDTITLLGLANGQDYVDLGDGFDTLILADPSNNIRVENVEVITGGSLTDTITVQGQLYTLDGILSNRTSFDTIINDGFIGLEDEITSGAGDFQNSATGILRLAGASGSSITFDSFSTNYGNVFLRGASTSTLTVTSTPFNNEGLFAVLDDGQPITHVFNGDFVNGPGGFLSVLEDFQVNGSLDMREGGGRVNTGKTLTIGNFTTLYVDDTTYFFEPDGTISFTGTATIDVTNTYIVSGGNPYHDFSQARVVVDSTTTGTFVLGFGGQLELTADEIYADFINQGYLKVQDGVSTLGGTVTTNPGSTIYLDGNDGNIANAPELDILGSFTNTGLVTLDNSDNSPSGVASLSVGGTFTNMGDLESLDSDNSLTETSVHTISGTFDNDPGAYFYVQAPVRLDDASALHINDGDIELDGGTLLISSSASFQNNGRIVGQGTVDASAPLLQTGEIDPDGGSPGLISFTGGLDAQSSSLIRLDIYNLGGSHDQIAVSGGLDLDGTIELPFLDTTGLSATGTTTVSNLISYDTIGVNTAIASHNLGSGYIVNLIDNTTSSTIDAQIIPSFGSEFDNGAVDGDWHNAVNWLGDVLPSPGDNLLVNGYTVSFAGTTTDTFNSLTLVNSTLDITAGTLNLDQSSRISGDATLNLNQFTGGANLGLGGWSVLEGTMNWGSGSIFDTATSTSTFNVLGTLNITAGQYFDVRIQNEGTINFQAPHYMVGDQAIDNQGQINVLESLTIEFPLNNLTEGFVRLGSASSTVDVTHSIHTVFSGGVYEIDTPGGFDTSLTFSGGAGFFNYGLVQVSDSGAAGATRTIDLATFDFMNAGQLSVDADLYMNIESSLFDSENGIIYVASGRNLDIDGGITGGTFDISAGTQFSGDGNINILGDVTLTMVGAGYLDAQGIYIDTTGGNLSLIGSNFGLTNGTLLGLNSDDSVSVTQFDNFGNLSLSGDNVAISGDYYNWNGSNLEINSGNGSGYKLIDDGNVENYGNIIFNQFGTDTNILDIPASGSGVLSNFGYIQSADTGGAINANELDAILINDGTLDLQFDFDLNETVTPAQHDNFGDIILSNGATLTLGVSNDLYNEYDGYIAGSGTLDVSGTDVGFLNDGYILAGGFSSTGVLTIAANVNTQFSRASIYEIELNGTTPGSGHDQLTLTGVTPELRGRLDIRVLSPFVPTSGQMFTIVTSVALMERLWDAIDGTDAYAEHGVIFDVDVNANDVTLTARVPDVSGTAGDDVLVTTAGADIVHAGDGNDVVLDIGAGDVVFGGFGDDFLELTTGLKRIDGGEGIDTLRFTGIPLVDLTNEDGFFIDSIEVLNFDDGTPQTIQLDADSIRYLADDGNDLLFGEDAIIALGDPTDHLILFGDFLVDGAGTKSFDVRSPGEFEDFTRLYTTTTGTTSIYIDQQMLTEVQRTDGAKRFFGSSGDDDITSTSTQTQTTGNVDWLFGRDGDDFLDGGGGTDVIYGGEGNDTILYDAADAFTPVEGGNGLDTLIDLSASASIDLSGVTNLTDFEVIDLADGDGNDVLSLGLTDILSFVGDNSLDSILPDGQTKLIINGDSGDVLNLDANSLGLATDFGGLGNGWSAPNGSSELDYFGNGSSYVLFSNGIVDVYVHADMIAPI